MAFADKAKYKARAVGQVVLGRSGEKKTPFVECYFEVIDGENKGGRVRWTGFFTENSAERTIESLQHCGWQGDHVGEFADGELHGLDSKDVQIEVELEPYEDNNGEKKIMPRVAWVNKLGGGYLNIQNAMPKEDAESFGEKMKGLVLKLKTKKAGPPNANDAFPHGANEPAPKQASGTKKGW